LYKIEDPPIKVDFFSGKLSKAFTKFGDMGQLNASIKLLFSFSVFLSLFSCGLKYTPPETPESFEQRRHLAIETHFKNQLQKDSLEYTSLAFGEPTVIKPASFKTLDSLFEIKYQNEQKKISDKELELQISAQREVLARDTSKIIYIENHVFSYPEEGGHRIVESDVRINKEMVILDEEIRSSYFVPNKHMERYKQFLFGESFLYPGTMATDEEEFFYQFYKNALITNESADDDAFLLHILELMELGHKKKSIRTVQLLLFQARKVLSGQVQPLTEESATDVYQTYENNDPSSGQLTGYWFIVSYTEKESNSRKQVYFKFDPYLRHISHYEL
jgi:hypothetical protein